MIHVKPYGDILKGFSECDPSTVDFFEKYSIILGGVAYVISIYKKVIKSWQISRKISP